MSVTYLDRWEMSLNRFANISGVLFIAKDERLWRFLTTLQFFLDALPRKLIMWSRNVKQFGFFCVAFLMSACAQKLYYYVSPTLPTRAIAVIRWNGTGGALGMVQFTQALLYGPVTIAGTLVGLPGGLRGFTIHQYGNHTHGCKSSGAHYNPDSSSHGANTDMIRHVGDLGNIQVDEKGMATISLSDPVIALHGRNNIIGRSLVVHANQDDLGKGRDEESLISGNAGLGVACGVIGLMSEIP